ncbi:cyclophilin-like fold protein [Streptomyces sp. enrichment culture]
MTVDGTAYDATPDDSATARDLAAQLPLSSAG